jgi:hypothetical protein
MMKKKLIFYLIILLFIFSCTTGRSTHTRHSGKTCKGMSIHNKDVQRGLAK